MQRGSKELLEYLGHIIRVMGVPSDDILRKEYESYVEQFLLDFALGSATEILFRKDGDIIRSLELINGEFRQGTNLKPNDFNLFRRILKDEIFHSGTYRVPLKKYLCLIDMDDNPREGLRLKIVRRPMPNGRYDALEDVFRAFEDSSWDAIKSIFLSILNLALAQDYDLILMEMKGPTVEITYKKGYETGTTMTISSDSYDSLARLIGDNYLAFGFMTRNFRDTEYLIRLRELNEDEVAPRIVIEIEKLR